MRSGSVSAKKTARYRKRGSGWCGGVSPRGILGVDATVGQDLDERLPTVVSASLALLSVHGVEDGASANPRGAASTQRR